MHTVCNPRPCLPSRHPAQLECLVQDAALRVTELQGQSLRLAENMAEGTTKRVDQEEEEARALSKIKASFFSSPIMEWLVTPELKLSWILLLLLLLGAEGAC